MNLSAGMKAAYADFLFAASGPGNIESRLHPHERVHLHAESLLDAQRHIPGQIGLAVQQAGQGRARHLKRGGRVR